MHFQFASADVSVLSSELQCSVIILEFVTMIFLTNIFLNLYNEPRTDMNGGSMSMSIFHRELRARQDAHDAGRSQKLSKR